MGILVDNFAGGGGASTAMEAAFGRHVDIAINHDPAAIHMHKKNHPNTEHHCENVWNVDPADACRGRPVDAAWFSPDCKHFSRAKGGTPKNRKIRGLAWVLLKWASLPEWQRPKIMFLENVDEFLTWRPLTKKGKIDKRYSSGHTFRQWEKQIKDLGYDTAFKSLPACDYGTATIRKRLFWVARRDGHPIRFPTPTHCDPRKDPLGLYEPWKTAADIMEWNVAAPSIFTRKRPLVANTQRRIAHGIKRFVLDNPEPFLIKVNHGRRDKFRGQGLDEPLKTLTQKNGHALIIPTIDQAYGQSKGMAADKPLGSITANPKASLITATIDQPYGTNNGERPGNDIKAPLGTITTQSGGKKRLITANMIHVQHSKLKNGAMPIDEPVRTITAKPDGGGFGLITACMAQHNTGVVGHPIDKPVSTITGRGTQQQMITASLTGEDRSDQVSALLKEYLKGVENMVNIGGETFKIVDIGMRMLTLRELYRAQGFEDDYDLCEGELTKTQIVSNVGNSVARGPAEHLILANLTDNLISGDHQLLQTG